MRYVQKEISLCARKRGFHLITNEIISNLPELCEIKTGILHVFIKHTSASLTISENADPEVRTDLEEHFRRMAPDQAPYYKHTYEGKDDMSAHIKNAILGANITIPITAGRLNTGTWQGIYLCEHRNGSGPRKLVVTLHGV